MVSFIYSQHMGLDLTPFGALSSLPLRSNFLTTTKMSHSHSHSESDTVPLHPSSQSDINEIKNQINASVQSSPTTVLPAKPPSPNAPPSPSPLSPSSNLTSPTGPSLLFQAQAAAVCPRPSATNNNGPINIAASGFGSLPNTLTEPVWDTFKRDLCRIIINLKLVVFPTPTVRTPERLSGIGVSAVLSSSLCSWVPLCPGLHLSRR
ncbi:hypothetical protein RchiOBHm_Chr5g0045341 [Rosa chinensis]|uniref:Uncharacterized protein n=1 Tax=Rosa chinensis TaxID=74649 RepID=A0A2P6QDV4_ROSCH|nr:hypothetical protein RchiOBHm_Chr5g0045341 [Rosa chinensis]